MNINNDPQNNLNRTMKSRHLFMLAIGGIIGTGLFLGSGYTLSQAGPLGAILAYCVGGLIMYLTMLCMGELAVAMPVAGSFQTYAARFISPAAGFTVGWNYWLAWAVTIALELLSAGVLMQRWFPDVPVWAWSLIFGTALFLVNVLSARAFAETEFWFSCIKVSAIILFIILGGGAVFGVIDIKGHQEAPMLSNFADIGLFPNGITGFLITMITVNFAFIGSELIGIAAGETENPEKNVPKSLRAIVWRTLIFYVLSIFVLSGMIPYKEAGTIESPFVAVFDYIGIPYTSDIMNFVILTALLSVANSGVYATTRMLWSLSQDNMAPKMFGKLNKRGVPLNALLLTMAFASLSLLSGLMAEDTVFLWLLSLSGLGVIISWIAICASQLSFRKHYVANGGELKNLKFKTPLYPYLPWFALLLNIGVLVSLAFDPAQRLALYFGIPFSIACYFYYYLRNKKEKVIEEDIPKESLEKISEKC